MDLGAILCGRAWGANPESDLVFDGKAESAAQDVADPLNLLQVMLAKGSRSSPAFLKRFRRVFVQRFMPGFLNGTTSKARGYRALQTLRDTLTQLSLTKLGLSNGCNLRMKK
jgi:hypothetical protein